MLTMRIPVSEKAKPRRITISGGESEPQQVGASTRAGDQGGSS